MDLTQQFKASVMTVRLQRKTELMAAQKNKAQQQDTKKLPGTTNNNKSNNKTIANNSFAKESKDVCNKITTLRNVLIENRTAYMRIGQHLKSATHMTDAQRDLIDRESEKFVTYYTQHLGKMRSDLKSSSKKMPRQERQHMEAVLDLLVSYLHSVEQIYLDQKKYRVQYELDTYRLLKLAADKKKIPVRPAAAIQSKRVVQEEDNDWNNDNWSEWDEDGEEREQQQVDSGTSSLGSATQQPRQRKRSRPAASANSTDSSAKVALAEEELQKQQEEQDEDPLSAEDIQLFEEENLHIYNLLQGVSEEVEQIGKNVVDIAQLQDIFTEKVAMQQHNIERIVSAVVGTTENVKDANEQIRQATQRNAGLRVWSLFFLLVMSFSLLFLDWYYD